MTRTFLPFYKFHETYLKSVPVNFHYFSVQNSFNCPASSQWSSTTESGRLLLPAFLISYPGIFSIEGLGKQMFRNSFVSWFHERNSCIVTVKYLKINVAISYNLRVSVCQNFKRIFVETPVFKLACVITQKVFNRFQWNLEHRLSVELDFSWTSKSSKKKFKNYYFWFKNQRKNGWKIERLL